jgi:hypothetical protein
MRTTGVLFCWTALLAGAEPVDFNRDVRPILSDRCFTCHGPDAAARKVPFRLDSEASAKADLGGRFVIVPGDTARSELVRRITSDKPALRMPPTYSKLKLSEAEIGILTRWVAEGARWQTHWSFIPPKAPRIPKVSRQAWVRDPIDTFVLERLEREKLEPSPEADKTTLIRRASLDVTGLPPTPEEVDAFLADSSPDAYERLLDRLFASPRYGERMAARWLDAARYADTNGYQTDAERHMWRWRDWVIDAFNSNMPFDRFAVEQIAGDLLPNATLDQKIATGFNRNHRGNSEGGIVPEEYLVEYAVDRVETMSTVFLGLTAGCARCHSHKYDPISQREFYQLFAYFNNIPELGRYLKFGNTPPHVKAPTAEQDARLRVLQDAHREAAQGLKTLEPAIERKQRAWEGTLAANVDWSPEHGIEVHIPLDEDAGGIRGGAARFDGARASEHGNRGAYGFYDKFTVSAWIFAEAGSGPIVTRAEDDPDGEGWGLYLDNGKLQVNLIKRRLDDSIRVETANKLETRRWQHVLMSYDGSRVATGVRIFVDGKPAEIRILLDAINQDFRTKEPLRIGSGGGGRFRGLIDEVRVYRRVLTDEEAGMLATRQPLAEIAAIPEARRSPAQTAKLRTAFLQTGAPPEMKSAWRAWRESAEARDRFEETISTVMIMEEISPPKETFLLVRGSYDRPGEKVTRGVPAVLPPLPAGAPANRLGLAKWLADRGNPLTARVAVNHFWQYLFGTGIVKTVEDFGSQGEPPSHPQLLDWLAVEFMRGNWDVKAIQRTMMTSATYRQSSRATPELLARDPDNRLLARGPRVRLPAEMVRDQALYAAGLLVEKIGGPSVKPYQPAGLWSELGGADYQRDRGEGLYRRSLYTYWKRTAPPPFMATFDSATRESCTVRQTRTNTPIQALNLMNDVTFVEAARRLAQRVMAEAGPDPSARIERAFRRTVARRPDEREVERMRASLAYYLDHFQSHSPAAEQYVSQGDSPRDPKLDPAELAAYTAVASLILNLDETVTKE